MVGNSGNLKGSQYGDLIDSSDFIIRSVGASVFGVVAPSHMLDICSDIDSFLSLTLLTLPWIKGSFPFSYILGVIFIALAKISLMMTLNVNLAPKC